MHDLQAIKQERCSYYDHKKMPDDTWMLLVEPNSTCQLWKAILQFYTDLAGDQVLQTASVSCWWL